MPDTRWEQMKDNYEESIGPRRRKVGETAEFLPEPHVSEIQVRESRRSAPLKRERKALLKRSTQKTSGEGLYRPETHFTQTGQGKSRETVGTRKAVVTSQELLHSLGLLPQKDQPDRKIKDRHRPGEAKKENRSGKSRMGNGREWLNQLPDDQAQDLRFLYEDDYDMDAQIAKDLSESDEDKEYVDLEDETLEQDDVFEDERGRESEKQEFQLPAADILRLGGLSAITAPELFPEMYRRGAPDTEEREKIEIRLNRMQQKRFLGIENEQGKTVEEIMQEYIATIASFLDTYGADLKAMHLAQGFISPEQYLVQYAQTLLRWYPKAYSNDDDFSHVTNEKLLGRMRDGLAKTFENSIRMPIEGLHETPETIKKKNALHFAIQDLKKNMYRIIGQLPYREKYEHTRAA